MKKLLAFLFAAVVGCVAYGAVRPVVAILGDSYSTYEGYVRPDTNELWYFSPRRSSTDVDNVRQTWWHRFVSDNGYKLGVNNSYSGATISRTGYHGEDYTPRSFETRMPSLGNPDIILVFGATNDSWAGSPIGDYKYSDWTSEDLYSFRPALASLLSNMVDRYPNVEIYFILNSELKPEINESVREICRHYGIPVVALHDIDKQEGHPTVAGMASIAEQVAEVVNAGNR